MTRILIIAGMATIPSREATFRRAVASIAPQVDRLHVWLSGHTAYLRDLPENVQQHKGLYEDHHGDAGKFLGIAFAYDALGGAHYLTFDDDLLYPVDYVQTLIEGIERYTRKAVVSFHGRSFGRFPISNYYRDATSRQYCLRTVERDGQAQVLGTGCMGFHTSTLDLSMDDFPTHNMADVHMAVAMKRQGVPGVVLKHSANWIQHLPVDHPSSIYNVFKDDCAVQTRLINEAFG